MRVRKIRRGFTTNSSASSEWVPPPGATESATTRPPEIPTTTTMGFKVGVLSGVVVLALLVERFFDYKRRKSLAKKTEDHRE